MSLATSTRTTAPETRTTAGRVRGVWRGPSAAFLGIPFAAAPTGEHRFTAPVAPPPWTGVRDATSYGPTPQRRPFGELTTIPEPSIPGEQTLNVNVFTPAPGDTAARLPVMVWIHGGGYFAGSPASPWYDGAAFNEAGIVTVTVSYRLGFDGFGWIDGAPLNRGILDQIAALAWVRDNIAWFGGDASQVTVAGQSAGAGSALALLCAPSARGLFRAVISQSGALGDLSVADAERAGRALAGRIGCGTSLGEWRRVPENVVLDHEREINDVAGALGAQAAAGDLAARIVRPGEGANAGPGLVFAPVVDGDVITGDIDTAVRDGSTAGVALLAGTTANEFAFSAPGGDPDGAVSVLRRAGVPDAALASYRDEMSRIGDDYATGQLWSTALFRIPAVSLARARAEAGQDAATWLYDFRLHAPSNGLASHCFDLPFTWGHTGADGVAQALGGPLPDDLGRTMHAAWVAFIRDGRAPWPRVDAAAAGAMVFDEESGYNPGAYGLEGAILDVRRARG